jgi:hypothetical protein
MKRRRRARRCARPEHDAGADRPRPAPPTQVGHENVRRAARYFMYRKWVYHAHGPMGKGNRVRLPPCVVELIRDRFREPGCDCPMGGPLYRYCGWGLWGRARVQRPPRCTASRVRVTC